MARRGGSGNRVRIIGGTHRGRLVEFEDQPGLRPTGDRVRETLFNWLRADIPGATCLDVFAGSGVLGFEAASRGARQVVMLEKSGSVAAQLEANARMLGIDESVRVIRADALHWLACLPGQAFDIVFVDPPFVSNMVVRVLGLLGEPGWLTSGARVYVEQDIRQADDSLPPGWTQVRDKAAGQVRYRLLRFDPSGSKATGGEG